MKRRNSLGVIERAHLRTNQEAFNEGYDRIFGTKSKSLHVETSDKTEEHGECEIQEFQIPESIERFERQEK